MVSQGSGHSGSVLFHYIFNCISGADPTYVMDINLYRTRCYLYFLWTLLGIKENFF